MLWGSDNDYLSLFLTEEKFKVAHLRFKGKTLGVVHLTCRDLKGISAPDVPGVISAVLKELNLRKATVLSVIPSHLTTTKNIEIPSLNPEEIASIINLQAGRHTPYSREEIILDYLNFGVHQRNYSKVLLAIVHRNVVKTQSDTLEASGVKLGRFVFAPEAMARWYALHLRLSLESPPVCVIDISGSFTDFLIVHNLKIIACRSLPLGKEQLTLEGPAALERLINEIRQSLESYQSEDIEKVPEEFILTQDDAVNKELQSRLAAGIKGRVRILSYLDGVDIPSDVKENVRAKGQESFLDVIAAAVVFKELQLDLTPEEIKVQRVIEAQAREITKLGALVVVILILFCMGFLMKMHFRGMALENLKRKYAVTVSQARDLEAVVAKTRIVKDYMKDRLLSLEAISELFRIIPEEVYLKSVILEEDGRLAIQGTSDSMSQVFALVGTLEESALFKSVKTKSTAAQKERGKDVAVFELGFKLESAKDDEPESAPKLKADDKSTVEKEQKAKP